MADKDPDVAQNNTRGIFFRAITGRRGADVDGTDSGGIRGKLLAAFGSSGRDATRPNTAAAAKGLGVSQRTVQRWLAQEGQERTQPRASNLKALNARARQAATTKRGRQQALATSRANILGNRGMRFTVNGVQGPDHGPGYARLRNVNFDLSPDQAQAFLAAWQQGGDAAAQQYITSNAPDIYHDSWVFEHINDVNISGIYGRN